MEKARTRIKEGPVNWQKTAIIEERVPDGYQAYICKDCSRNCRSIIKLGNVPVQDCLIKN